MQKRFGSVWEDIDFSRPRQQPAPADTDRTSFLSFMMQSQPEVIT